MQPRGLEPPASTPGGLVPGSTCVVARVRETGCADYVAVQHPGGLHSRLHPDVLRNRLLDPARLAAGVRLVEVVVPADRPEVGLEGLGRFLIRRVRLFPTCRAGMSGFTVETPAGPGEATVRENLIRAGIRRTPGRVTTLRSGPDTGIHW
jgi:hypothetical protein